MIASEKVAIISLTPNSIETSVTDEIFKDFNDIHDVAVITPDKMESQERALVSYDVKIARLGNLYHPLYIWRGSPKTFKGEWTEKDGIALAKLHMDRDLSLESFKPQALIYEVRQKDQNSKLVLFITPDKDQITVTSYFNNLNHPLFSFQKKKTENSQNFHTELIRKLAQYAFKYTAEGNTLSSNLKNVQKATLSRVFVVTVDETTPKIEAQAFHGFHMVTTDKIALQGNPHIASFVTEMTYQKDSTLTLDRIIDGTPSALKAYVEKNMFQDTRIVRNEKDLLSLLTKQRGTDQNDLNKKYQFLKQDMDMAITTCEDSAIARLVDSLLLYFGDTLAWEQMPRNIKNKEDLIVNIKDVLTQAKRLGIPDIVLLSITDTLLNPQNEHSPFNPKNYQKENAPGHYVVLQKSVNLMEFLPLSIASTLSHLAPQLQIEFYYSFTHNKISHWVQFPGVAL